jgi:hypothetical protein
MVEFGLDGAVGDEEASDVSHIYFIEEAGRVVKAADE